jgi:hypothetical protein
LLVPKNYTHQLWYFNLSNRQVVQLKKQKSGGHKDRPLFFFNCDDIGNTISSFLHVSIFISAVEYIHFFLRLVTCFHTFQRSGNGKNRHVNVGQIKGQNTHSENIMNDGV